MKVLVYGGTGSQGSPVVRKLIEHGHTPVVLTRSVDKAREMFGAAAEYIAGDMLNADDTRRASEGVDAVSLLIPFFVANPPQDMPQMAQNAINAAKDADVKLIVYNTSGPTPQEDIGMPGSQSRIATREWLRNSGVPHIILAPTGYMENLLGPWTVNEIREHDALAYPNPSQARLGWIATEDVAALQVAALERPELADSEFIVSGIENPNGHELAEQVGRGIGRDLTYREMPLDEFAAKIDAAFGPGAGAGAKAGYEFNRTNGEAAPPMWVDMKPVLDKLPVQMTSISEWAAQFKEMMAKPETASS